ncbi:MAG: hypothetical protein FWF82_03330 [Oscillospiraceae bacterium]|nr:hypothetical protein [Oscillospiraceae bacterium]
MESLSKPLSVFGVLQDTQLESDATDYYSISLKNSGSLTLDTRGSSSTIDIIIYSSLGESVWQGSGDRLNTIELISGTYYISVRNTYSYSSRTYRITTSFKSEQAPPHDVNSESSRTYSITTSTVKKCNWKDWDITVTADCTKNGVKIRKCADDCGEEEIDSIPMLSHEMTSWSVASRATCSKGGSRSCECKGCGRKEEETTDPTGFGGSGVCFDCGVNSRKLGDIDGDGNVDINDALNILKYLAKLDCAVSENDCNYSSALITSDIPTINDALEILKKLAKLPNKIDGTA